MTGTSTSADRTRTLQAGPVRLLTIGVVLALGVAFTACGDDDGDGTAVAGRTQEGETTETPSDDGATPPASGTGSGTLAVDGKNLAFDVTFCGFGPEETRNDDVDFSFRGTGSDAGRDFSVDASIVNLSVAGSESVIHSVDMWYDDANTVIVYSSESGLGQPEAELQLDGKNVRYEGDFTADEGARPAGPGTLDATCP